MKTKFLIAIVLGATLVQPAHAARFLFDADHAQSGNNADWVIDADVHNLTWLSSGTFTTSSGNESNAQRIPTPAASGIVSNTPETYWAGAISAWAVDLVKRGHSVETLPAGTTLTWNTANSQDLTNYDVVVIDEPDILFATSEKQALLNFVSHGGGLFMISDHVGSIRTQGTGGIDAVTVWNDFLTNNGITNNPFGITFRISGTGTDSSGNNTFNRSITGNPILNGLVGVATNMAYFNGNEFQIDNTKNPTTISQMWFGLSSDSNNLCGLASLQYGSGRVVVCGDSSCIDDGTGDPNDTSLFDGYTTDAGGVQHIWILNSSEWLAAPFVPGSTNSWILGSGKWETNAWSLGHAPSINDSADLITNAGNNTVTIDSTTVNTPGVTTVSNLTVSANTLALSSTGTNIVRVLNSLAVMNTGAVTITSANLQSPGNGLVLDVDGGGALTLNSGTLVLTNGSSRVGESSAGALTVNGGAFLARDMILGLNGGSAGTLTVVGGASELRNTLTLGFVGGSTGTVWMTGGSMVVSNATTILGSSGVGSMTISNGSWLTTQMYVANENTSVGTLTLAGGSMTMSDNAFGVQPILKVGGADSGTPQATGTVWVTGGQMLFSNATVTVGDFGVGQMTVSNGTFWANQMFIAVSSTAQGTVTFAGGNSQIFSTLDVGVFDNSTGTVWLTGGQLTVTNDRINVGLNGQGQMIMSNGTLLANEIVLGTNGTAAGTFTSYGGQVTITGPHTLIIGNTPGANGLMAFRNGVLDSHVSPVLIGDAGTGSLDLSNSSAQALNVVLGSRSGGVGALTLRDLSTLVVSSNLTAGSASGSTGMVMMTGGSLFVTNANNNGTGIIGLGNTGDPSQGTGFGQMTIANASVTADGILLGSSLGGHGQLVVKTGGIIHIPAQSGCTACGLNFNEGILDGGTIDAPQSTMWAGRFRPGEFIVSNGVATFQNGFVGFDNLGSLTQVGGMLNVLSNLVVGTSPGATGIVTMTGGLVFVTNGVFAIGNGGSLLSTGGVGHVTLSNGVVEAASILIGDNFGSESSLTVAGSGSVRAHGGLRINGNHTTTVNGGTLEVVLGPSPAFEDPILHDRIVVSYGADGTMIVSNGLTRTPGLLVGASAGNTGTLQLPGGITSVFSNMTVGFVGCASTGIVNVTGGSLYVTNGGTATLEIRSGTFTLSAGIVSVDRFVMTNACAHFVRTGGTLIYGTAVLDPNRDDDGDGIPNGYELSHGLDPLNPADASADNDGDGLSNLQEFQAGTDPNNSASSFLITSVVKTGNDVRVTWMMGPGKTNALQWTAGTGNGSYQTNNFADLFGVTNTLGTVTNYLDVGGATNRPTRYYRVRLVP